MQSLEWCLFKCSCPDLNAFLFNSNSFTSYMSIVYILAHRRVSGYISQNIFLQKVLHIIYSISLPARWKWSPENWCGKYFVIKIATMGIKRQQHRSMENCLKSQNIDLVSKILLPPKEGRLPTKHNLRPIIHIEVSLKSVETSKIVVRLKI